MTKSVFRVLGLVASMVVGGAAVAADAPAVQWKVSDGGNGHWYAEMIDSLIWTQMRTACEAKGGHLATLTSQAEWNWVKTQLPIPYWECFVGGYQDHTASTYSEPNGGWRWVTGEPFAINLAYMGSATIFGPMIEPGFDDCPGGSAGYCGCGPGGAQDVLFFTGCCNNILDDIGDGVVQNCDSVARRGIIEWSADCNEDGSVDYGQIQSGELADTNNNGVPDVCELVITSVKPVSGASTGGTAVRINGNNFPSSPTVTFGGVSATDIVRVSPSLITAVTPAGTPGMTLVAVNSATSESFYYRPSCDGDLDNNGTIDSSDLGLLLINMGDCSSSLTTPQEQEPLIFQVTQTPVLNKK